MPLLERRSTARFLFHSRAVLRNDVADYPGLLLDISAGGCLFLAETRPSFSTWQQCRLSVDYAGRHDFLALEGHIVHTENGPVGIAFAARTPSQEQSLQRMIAFRRSRFGPVDQEIPALLRKFTR